jgi:hypothetical protein
MSEDERSQSAMERRADAPAAIEEEDDEEDGGSPFDHPAFLPVLLWALAVWFGYDGWINQDPDMLEHTTFNRVGFGVLVAAGTYYTVQWIRERRATEETDPTREP